MPQHPKHEEHTPIWIPAFGGEICAPCAHEGVLIFHQRRLPSETRPDVRKDALKIDIKPERDMMPAR